MFLSQSGQFRLACCVAVLPLALAGCARLAPGEPPAPTAPVAACAHFLAAADAALATPPDSITGTSSGQHAYAAAMAQYHACVGAASIPGARLP